MKKFLPNPILTRTLLLGLVFLLLGSFKGYGQLTTSMAEPCSIEGCQASDVVIGEVYLGDANSGNKIPTCNVGDPLTDISLYAVIDKAASKEDLYLQFYLLKDGVQIDLNGDPDLSTNKISISLAGAVPTGQIKLFDLPDYECGQELRLTDIFFSWQPKNTEGGPGCNSISSKCAGEQLVPIDVNTPLSVDFTASTTCDPENGFYKVVYEDNSTGGDGTLNYTWNFGTDANPSTISGPGPHEVSYISGGNKTVRLTVTDEDNDSDFNEKPIEVFPVIDLTTPSSFTTNACQSQAQIDIDFSNFLNSASSTGGQNVTITALNTPTAPSKCGGSTTVTWEAKGDNCSTTGSATFTVPNAPTLSVNCPDDVELSCPTQSDVNSEFSAWINEFYATGGCGTTSTGSTGHSAPDVCGGSVTVDFSALDECGQTANCSATFTVATTTNLVVTVPDPVVLDACTPAADIQTAYNTWKEGFSVAGGCSPEDNMASFPALTDLTCGGVLNFTLTANNIAGGCVDSDEGSSSFTVGTADNLVVTVPDPVVLDACTPAADIQTAYNTWKEGFSVAGGCSPEDNMASFPALTDLTCGGVLNFTLTANNIAGGCVDSDEGSSSFTVGTADNLVVTVPDPVVLDACTPAADIQTAYNTWKEGFSVAGGCSPEDNMASFPALTDLTCGGVLNFTLTANNIAGGCVDSDEGSSSFTVGTADNLVVTVPDPVVLDACTPAADIQTAYNTWKEGFSVAGGCSPEDNMASFPALTDLTCGGVLNFTLTANNIAGGCVDSDEGSSSFTVGTADNLVVTVPDPVVLDACTPAADIQTAYNTWKEGFSVAGGCSPEDNMASFPALTDLTCGGVLNFTLTANNIAGGCVDSDEGSSSFTVGTADNLVVTVPDPVVLDACTPAADIQTAYNTWKEGFSVAGGCSPEDNMASFPALTDLTCGGVLNFTLTANNIAGGCVDSDEGSSSFTVGTADNLVVTVPDPVVLDACTPAADIQTAYNTWKEGFSVAGGCSPEDNMASFPALTDLTCGGALNFTLTANNIAGGCVDSDEGSSSFTVGTADNLVVTVPDPVVLDACTPAADIQTAYNTWKEGFSVAGGCSPEDNMASFPALTDLTCGGVLNFTLTANNIAGGCVDSDEGSSSFTVGTADNLVVTVPDPVVLDACTPAADIQTAYNTWKEGFSVAGGCSPEDNMASFPALTDLTCGGVLNFTLTANNIAGGCVDSDEGSSSFTVGTADNLVVTVPDPVVLDACTPAADIQTAYNTWKEGFSVAGGCSPEDNMASFPALTDLTCGGVLNFTLTANNIAGGCVDSDEGSSSFTVGTADNLVVTVPDPVVLDACTPAADIQTAYNTWKEGFSVAGGCSPEDNMASFPALTDLTCGGVLNFTLTANNIAGGCVDSDEGSSSFTVGTADNLVVTVPDPVVLDACTPAADIQTAYNTWKEGFSVAGGCSPEDNMASFPALTDLTCGGVLNFTLTANNIAGGCVDSDEGSSSFTVGTADNLVVTVPDPVVLDACTPAADIQTAYNTWKEGFSVAGGCSPEDNMASFPALTDLTCGGVLNFTLTANNIAGGCVDSDEGSSSFTVGTADNLVVTVPDPVVLDACTPAADIQTAYNTWKEGFSVAGGCSPEDNMASFPALTDLTCGGVLNFTLTANNIAGGCVDSDEGSSSFTVGTADNLVVTVPDPVVLDACTPAADIQTAYNTWKEGFSVAGGCSPEDNMASFPALTDLTCGGVLNFTLTANNIAGGCVDSDEGSSSFTVGTADNLVVTVPDPVVLDACTPAADIQTAYNTWKEGFSVAGGCSPEDNMASFPALTDLTCGGVLNFTLTANNIAGGCVDSDEGSSSFTVGTADNLVVTVPDPVVLDACTPAADIQTAYNTWKEGFSVAGGCSPEDNMASFPALTDLTCGGALNFTLTANNIAGGCVDSDEGSSSFTVGTADNLVVTVPDPVVLDACTPAADIQTAYNTWKEGFSVAGGCSPEDNMASFPALTDLTCGGVLNFTLTANNIAGGCVDSDEGSSSFTVGTADNLVVTVPDPVVLDACTPAADIQTAYNTWKEGFSVAGGCSPEDNMASFPALTDLTCGGVLNFTLTANNIAGGCVDSDEGSSSFTVGTPTPIIITKAVNKNLNSSDLANQTAAQAAFDSWLATASVSGGCTPTSTPNTTTAPEYCGGSVEVTWTIEDKCYTTFTYSATFTINAADPVVVTEAVDADVDACDLADQAAAQTAFDNWLATASVSGGCTPTSTPDITAAPAYCGGSVTVTWTIEDKCYTTTQYSATFTINAADPVMVTEAVDADVDACDLADQAAAQTAFDNWLATASVSGGCTPTSTPDINAAPAYCGGSVTVTWTIEDKCYTTTQYSATFTINAADPVMVTEAVDADVDACDLADQAAAQTAFDNWLATASVSGGCTPTSTPDINAAPAYCGGSVTVTWTIEDKCYTTTQYSATFTINAADPVVVTEAVDADVDACDLADQAAAQTAFDNWLATASVSGGCTPTSTPDINAAPAYCGGSVTVTWTIEDKCYTTTQYSATFTINAADPVVVTEAVDADVDACDLADQAAAQTAFDNWLATASVSGGCTPTSTPDINAAPAYCGGSVTVTWTIEDHCYTTSSYSATFTINSTTPTFVEELPENVTVECDAIPVATVLTATDNCGEATVSMVETRTDGGCPGSYILTRTWTATDNCGNTTEYEQTINVEDNTAPEVTCNDITVQLDANGVATITVNDINGGTTDACSGIDTMFISQETFYCGSVGDNEVTLTAIDECGNEATCTATVTVEEGDADCGFEPFKANDDILTLIYCPGGTVSGDIDLFANDEGFTRENVSFNILTDLPEGVSVTDGELLYVNEEANEAVITFTYSVCHTFNTENCDTAEVTIHVLLDTDCDGVPDIDDIDDDDDGILDIIEEENALDQTSLDSDGDGIVDRLDIDSDNDGIVDNIEWQSTIAEEGEYDYILPSGTDSNGDGWDDAYDPADNGITYEPWDMDIDGTPDYLDTNTDNEGEDDSIEGWDEFPNDSIADVNYMGSDADGDGLDDAYDTYNTTTEGWTRGQNAIGSDAPLQDTDEDGVRDWRDAVDDRTPPQQFACGEPVIPNAFSPNQDGYNDYFKIMIYCTGDQGGSEERVLGDDFADARIEIFNRWGNLVYEQERYGNEDYWGDVDAWWDGTSMHDMQVGKDQLPTATYFYILYFNDGSKEPVTGFIFLNN